MSASSKALLLAAVIFVSLSLNAECHELLTDFLKFPEQNSQEKLNQKCVEDLKILKRGIEDREIWALKVLDASGKSTAGFVWGNNFWLGSNTACRLLNNPKKINLGISSKRRMLENVTEIASKVKVEYRMLFADHTSELQFDADLFNKSILHVGLCFPMSCVHQDVDIMARRIFQEKFKNDPLIRNVFYIGTKTLVIRENFINDQFVQLLIIVSSIFFILIIIGTGYTARLNRHHAKLDEKSYMLSKKNDDDEMNTNHQNHNRHTNVSTNHNGIQKKSTTTSRSKVSIMENFGKSFSLVENVNFIMSLEIDSKSIPTIHGLKGATMLWIIMGHVYFYAFGPAENSLLVFVYAEYWFMQPFFSVAISVDSFFAISGFLVSYMLYDNLKGLNVSDMLKAIIYRYARITPPVMIIMLIAVTISMFINDTSQFTMIEDIEKNCKLYWWRNLLFIQNLYPLEEICMSWSWYVATDLQLFSITMISFAIFSRYKRLGVILPVVIFFASALYCGYCGIRESFSFSLDSQFSTADSLYLKPYTRVGGYFTGVLTGFYMKQKNRQLNLSKTTVNFLQILAVAIITLMMFIQGVRAVGNYWVSVLFPAFGRAFWNVAICIIIVVGASQHKNNFLSQILNSKYLLPLSRISYSAYLLNPLVVILTTMSSEVPFHADIFTFPIFGIGFCVLAYIVAFVFMIMFENPIVMTVRKVLK